MSNRVMIVGWSNYRDMIGTIVATTEHRQEVVLLDALQMPPYPMAFELRELVRV